MLRVSFSPAPDCVDGDCWNRSFSTPTRHQEHRSSCYCFVLFAFTLVLASFLGRDYHYTTIIFHTTKVNIDIGTKILKAKFAGRKRHFFNTPQKFKPICVYHFSFCVECNPPQRCRTSFFNFSVQNLKICMRPWIRR